MPFFWFHILCSCTAREKRVTKLNELLFIFEWVHITSMNEWILAFNIDLNVHGAANGMTLKRVRPQLWYLITLLLKSNSNCGLIFEQIKFTFELSWRHSTSYWTFSFAWSGYDYSLWMNNKWIQNTHTLTHTCTKWQICDTITLIELLLCSLSFRWFSFSYCLVQRVRSLSNFWMKWFF